MKTREFYIPTQATRIPAIDGIEAYKYTNGQNKLVGLCFVGKQIKPSWRYIFSDMVQLTEALNVTVNKFVDRQQEKAVYREWRKQNKKEAIQMVNVGDIFVESFSYESTTISFWQMVFKKGGTVGLKEINRILVNTDSCGRSEYYIPHIDSFIDNKLITRSIKSHINDTVYLCIPEAGGIHHFKKWNGKSVYETNIYWR